MPDPVTLETKPRQPATWSPAGAQRYRSFTIIAKSESAAKEQLLADKGIEEGVEYVDHTGERPDPDLVCLAIEVEALTQLPSSNSGLLGVHAAYGYRSSTSFRRRSNPMTPPQYWVDRGLRSEVIDTDVDGEPIVNDADEVFDPPLTVQIPTETLIVEYWRSGTNFLTVYGGTRPYIGKTNSVNFKGPNNVECFYCESILIDQNATRHQVPGLWWFRHTARFEFRPNRSLKNYLFNGGYNEILVPGWRKALMNRGRRCISSVNGGRTYYRQIHEANDEGGMFDPGRPLITDPVFLAAGGFNVQSKPNYKVFQIYETIDFNQIGI